MSEAWDLDGIAAVLGGGLSPVKPGVWALRIVNPILGIRLKVELAPAHGAVRLWCDRDRATRPSFVGRTDLFGVVAVIGEMDQRRVRFRTNGGRPNELLVTADGTFRVVVGIDPAAVTKIPVETSAETDGAGETITVVGTLARPRYAEPKGRALFTAGLAEYADGATAPVWHDLKAWGGVAKHARELQRGQRVCATGEQKEETYVTKEGEARTSQVLILTSIEPC